MKSFTVLSRASAHGHSQLKRQNLRVSSCTEEVLKWFNYQTGCKVSCQGVPNRLASSLRSCFIEASPTVEKAVTCCKADQLVASLPSFYSIQSWLAVRKFRAAGEECCEQGHGQVCVNLMSWPQKCLRTIAADLPSDSLHQDLAWRAVTWKTSKTKKLSKLGGGHLPGTIRNIQSS